jgi:type IV pilus assembly protein PilB
VRFCLENILQEIASPPVTLALRLTMRLKVMSRLKISEHRVPQDGRTKMQILKKARHRFPRERMLFLVR